MHVSQAEQLHRNDYHALPFVFYTLVALFAGCALLAAAGFVLDRRDSAILAAKQARAPARDAALRARLISHETTLQRESMPSFVTNLDSPLKMYLWLLWTTHSWCAAAAASSFALFPESRYRTSPEQESRPKEMFLLLLSRRFSIFTAYQPAASRPRRCVVFLFNLLLIIFTQSLCFWLAFPPGFCGPALYQENCEAKQSLYAEFWAGLTGTEVSRDACVWVEFPLAGAKQCQLRPADPLDMAVKRLFLVFMAVSIAIPFQIVFEMNFVKFVCAPLIAHPPSPPKRLHQQPSHESDSQQQQQEQGGATSTPPEEEASGEQPLSIQHAVGQQLLRNLLMSAPAMEIESLAVERCYALRSLSTALTIEVTQRYEARIRRVPTFFLLSRGPFPPRHDGFWGDKKESCMLFLQRKKNASLNLSTCSLIAFRSFSTQLTALRTLERLMRHTIGVTSSGCSVRTTCRGARTTSVPRLLVV